MKISELYKKNKLTRKEARKIADEITLRDRPEDTIINTPEGRAIINKEKAPLFEPDFFNIITKELAKLIEGEKQSRKAIFLSLCSIWVEDSEIPINTFVSSESSAGKSYICKQIIKIFPKDLIEYRTKITPEAFTYWHNEEDWSWDGKICYLEDVSQSILDAPTFKVMCSEGSVATIVRNQKAVDLYINGKPSMLVTTASTNPKSEILNRFQIVSLDESAKQTKAITLRQAKISETGVIEKYDPSIIKALGRLERKKVKIPYGTRIHYFLDQNYNFESLRLRRDFDRLISLIKCSAVLYQFQRESDENGRVIANEQDYSIARECINYIQTQTFKGLTHRLRKAFDCCKKLGEFTAREIYSKFPFVNQKMWYIYLNDLLKRGMLRTELRKVEDVKQKVNFFMINEEQSFKLPEFDKLPINITNDTIVTKETKVTKVTKDKGTIVTNVTNVSHNQVSKGAKK